MLKSIVIRINTLTFNLYKIYKLLKLWISRYRKLICIKMISSYNNYDHTAMLIKFRAENNSLAKGRSTK